MPCFKEKHISGFLYFSYGIDGDGFFEPEFYEEGESPYYEWTGVNSSNSITNPAFKVSERNKFLQVQLSGFLIK